TLTMVQSNTATATSTLFLKAKHAFSLHRKSSLSGNSSSSASAYLSSSAPSPTDSTVSPPLSTASSAANTNANANANANATANGGAPHKVKRSSRFKVKRFASFRDRSTSPPHSKKGQANHANAPVSVTTTATTTTTTTPITASNATPSSSAEAVVKATTTRTTPPAQTASMNPYSPSWCPSTVAALRSPLRSVSSLSSKSNGGLDLLQSSHYSPAPNLLLQPSPVTDLAPRYGTGARLSRFPSGQSSGSPVVGPQGKNAIST
ncbi:hypothetical protein BC939DRAFT_457996, partial [Gamsiella multidivaricata]|uniref:uncharacterized protein n=1 Tax=Gamsiella multidivaricata TaxID=101098 RepID=UPI0022207EAB